ncbi:UNVERIFIED_CONTAM: hypothetical protein FKN15_076376 [Acipenser sinensis]
MADAFLKQRCSQFTVTEKLCLLEEYNAEKEILLGKFSEKCTNVHKHKAWDKITKKVNSVNPLCVRSVKDVQKRWKNMVQDAKKEIFKRKHPRTGGGPPSKLKRTTELVIEIFGEESPMFWGIAGGRESGVCVSQWEAPPVSISDHSVAVATLSQASSAETETLLNSDGMLTR